MADSEADGWTADLVEAELRAAVATLWRVPSRNLWPAGLRTAWPDVVQSWDSYGWDKATRPRMQATAAQIAAMDRAFAWLWDWLHPAAAKAAGLVEDVATIVLLRAGGMTWDRITAIRVQRWLAPQVARRGPRQPIPGGNSVVSLRRQHREAIALIVQRLGGGAERRVDREPEHDLGVVVEVAPRGGSLGEGTYGPVHARARHALVPRRRRR